MLSIAFSAILAASIGQLPPPPPPDNPFENVLNILKQDTPIYEKGMIYAGPLPSGFGGYYPPGYGGYDMGPAGYGGGYPTSYGGGNPANYGSASAGRGRGQTAGAGAFISGYAPKCNQGAYIGCGTYIGAFPGGTACPGTMAQMSCQGQGGFCPMQQPAYIQPSFPVQSGVLGRLEDEKDHKEINLRLEQLKILLTKMTDTLKEMEKRVETTEKASLSAEIKIKGLQDELKQRWFWQDMETKLDQRLKPIEDSLKHLSIRMEYLHKQADHAMSPDAKKSGAKGFDESLLLSISEKLDLLELVVFGQLKKLDDRLNKLEKGGALPTLPPPLPLPPPPKEDVKKDEKKEEPKKELKKDEKGDTSNLSKLKVARVSHVHGGAPSDRAVLIVQVPAEAKLYLNGQLTKSVGTQRTFVTPELEAGAIFVYNLRVELTNKGEVLTQTRTVPFRAGGQAHIVFEGPRIDVQTARK